MKLIFSLVLMLASAFQLPAATTWPAATNAPNTFFSSNTFLANTRMSSTTITGLTVRSGLTLAAPVGSGDGDIAVIASGSGQVQKGIGYSISSGILTGNGSGLSNVTSVAYVGTDVALAAKAATGQSANLFEAQNSSGNPLANITAAGVFTGNGSGLTNIPLTALTGPQVLTNQWVGGPILLSNQLTRIEAGGANTLVLTNQKVGIGTGNPNNTMDVVGTVLFDGGNGDFNLGGTTTSADTVLISRYLDPVSTTTIETNRLKFGKGDVNGDGILTFEDSTVIGRISAGQLDTNALSKKWATETLYATAYRTMGSLGAIDANKRWTQPLFVVLGDLGIGKTAPTAKLDVGGCLNFSQFQEPPMLCVGTPTAGGSCTPGTHSYKVTFVNNAGETSAGSVSTTVTNVLTTGQTTLLTGIPIGPAGSTQSRNLYKTVAGNTGNYLFIATISNNTDVTYSDTIADGSLGSAIPSVNTTLFGQLRIGGQPAINITSNNMIGIGSLSPIAKLHIYSTNSPVFIVSGTANTNLFIVDTNGDVRASGSLTATNGVFSGAASNVFALNVDTSGVTNNLVINAGSANTLVVTNGRVGIGKAPSTTAYSLFSGGIRADSLYSDGNVRGTSITSAGAITGTDATLSGTLTATNGVYAGAQANTSIAAMNNPLSFFGTLRMTATNQLEIPTDATYFNVTNWNNAITNQFTCNLTTGYLTNAVAGYYGIRATISFIGAPSELYEICVLTNGVDSEMVSSKKEFAPSTARYDCVPVIGRMYLPAGTGVSLAVKNTSDNTALTIHRACLDIGP